MELYWLISCLFASAVIGGVMGYGGRVAALWGMRRELVALGQAIDPKSLATVADTASLVRELATKVDQIDRATKSLAGRFGQQEKREKLGPADLETLAALVAARLGRAGPVTAETRAQILREVKG